LMVTSSKSVIWGQSLLISRPPQVDIVPARYIFFANVPVKMRDNSDKSDI
jgi:hypothetical protein